MNDTDTSVGGGGLQVKFFWLWLLRYFWMAWLMFRSGHPVRWQNLGPQNPALSTGKPNRRVSFSLIKTRNSPLTVTQKKHRS